MRDETIKALLDVGRVDEQTDSIGTTRDEVERRIRVGEIATGAVVTTERAVLLLFDILVGITLGHLRHDQTMWLSTVEALDDTADRDPCGTYRCVAGWIAHLAYPDATIDYPQSRRRTDPSGHYRAVEADALSLPGGNYTIRTLAAAVLLDTTPAALAHHAGVDIPEPVRRMFVATNRLVELWEYAFEMTGGAITVPAALREQVEATREQDRSGTSPVDDLIGATGYDDPEPGGTCGPDCDPDCDQDPGEVTA